MKARLKDLSGFETEMTVADHTLEVALPYVVKWEPSPKNTPISLKASRVRRFRLIFVNREGWESEIVGYFKEM